MLTIVRAPGKEFKLREGAVAQLGERRVRNAKVRGSIPLGSTTPRNKKLSHNRMVSQGLTGWGTR
jgi:hypothetical protein